MKTIIAIDPGAKGAIAIRMGHDIVSIQSMPETCTDLANLIREAKLTADENNDDIVAYLEEVHAMPGQGTVSMFTFGQGYGHLEQVLADFRIRTIKVRPSKWEKALSLTDKKGTEKREHKNKLKQRAQELFPNIKVTLVNADALLISEYAYQIEH
jgi:crossover junction endodeoxyribonuclease RuvC